MSANTDDVALPDTAGHGETQSREQPIPERDDLDFDTPFCAEWERAWSEEVNRREADAVARGEPLIPHEVVMARLRARSRR